MVRKRQTVEVDGTSNDRAVGVLRDGWATVRITIDTALRTRSAQVGLGPHGVISKEGEDRSGWLATVDHHCEPVRWSRVA